MKLKCLNKVSHKNFDLKINKKSNYLNHLPNQNTKSLKTLCSKKIDILIDEISGNKKFKRNYLFFNYKQNNYIKNKESDENIKEEKNISKNIPTFSPYLKVIMTSPYDKEYPEKYRKKDFMIDEFSGMYLKPKPMSLHKIKQNKIANNSYKQSYKINKNLNSSEFCLPLINKNRINIHEIKNNQPFFSIFNY